MKFVQPWLKQGNCPCFMLPISLATWHRHTVKPVILVPSPNVAEDHQTKNALALVNKNAALYIKDAAAKEALLDKAIETVQHPELLKSLSTNIAKLAFTDSANVIAREVYELADDYRKRNEC